MKCFTVRPHGLDAGIDTIHNVLHDRCVFVGDGARAMHLDLLLFAKNPPIISADEKVYDAHPVRISKNRYVLGKPRNIKDDRILVRIMHYECRVMTGSATEIGFGFSFCDVDEDVTYIHRYDSIRILTPGTALFLNAKCNPDKHTHVLIAGRHTAKFMVLEEFDARMGKYETEAELDSSTSVDRVDMPEQKGGGFWGEPLYEHLIKRIVPPPQTENPELRRLKLGGSGPEIPDNGFVQ